MQNLDRFNFKIAIHSKKINGCDLPCGVYDVFGFQKSFTLLQIIVFFNQKKYFIDLSTHSFTLLQCTGLKDKNGKLVFEKDIVQVHIKKDKKDNFITPNFTYGVCEWYMYSFFIQKIENNTNTTKKVLSIDFFDTLEIIGNQFENPELIENI